MDAFQINFADLITAGRLQRDCISFRYLENLRPHTSLIQERLRMVLIKRSIKSKLSVSDKISDKRQPLDSRSASKRVKLSPQLGQSVRHPHGAGVLSEDSSDEFECRI